MLIRTGSSFGFLALLATPAAAQDISQQDGT
jgi:hypothetical protein